MERWKKEIDLLWCGVSSFSSLVIYVETLPLGPSCGNHAWSVKGQIGIVINAQGGNCLVYPKCY